MLDNTPTIAELRQIFMSRLHDIYESEEISSLFSIVVEDILGYNRAEMHVRLSESVHPVKIGMIEAIIEGLIRQEPIQYMLGKAEFYGMNFRVNPHVLIPRPETEELVRWIIDEVNPVSKEMNLIDLGTGSGCIAIALKKHLTRARVYGIDKSVSALNIAQQNAELNGVGVDFFGFDLLERESLNFMEFDVMVSNPPYVTYSDKEEMSRNVLDYEPHEALFVENGDPLLFYRKIVDLADGHLNKNGKIFFEINERFGPEIRSLLTDRGYNRVEIRADLNGKDRMVKAEKS